MYGKKGDASGLPSLEPVKPLTSLSILELRILAAAFSLAAIVTGPCHPIVDGGSAVPDRDGCKSPDVTGQRLPEKAACPALGFHGADCGGGNGVMPESRLSIMTPLPADMVD